MITVLPTKRPQNKDILYLSNISRTGRESVVIKDKRGQRIRANQIKNESVYNVCIFLREEKIDEFSVELYFSHKYNDNMLIRHRQQQQ